ncbi:rubredoxin [Gallaecimonas kandeliae]|uniref:rubredoxin n=1 Tax=Gallaecimonas kandeliae TaxID=3029055 RepID=UPI0026486D89|nr:rubredoxin [Gallaecimonas kandeliae]WKE67266.1 rubredoxin [Gallaecimonas kandeliae]
MTYRKFECTVCGHIYDEEKGEPEDGIAPGTLWDELPDDWVCPECGAAKADYVEITE